MNKAVFFDRDGVINEDGDYICRPEDIRFMDGIFGFCDAARKKGYLLVIVTNQSGIARGYYTEEDYLSLTRWLEEQFARRGIAFDGIYYCPYHPDKGVGAYKKDHPDRKPSPGMLLRACKELDIDPAASVMIGDRDSDMEAGRRAGVGKLVLLAGIYDFTEAEDVAVCRGLNEAETLL